MCFPAESLQWLWRDFWPRLHFFYLQSYKKSLMDPCRKSQSPTQRAFTLLGVLMHHRCAIWQRINDAVCCSDRAHCIHMFTYSTQKLDARWYDHNRPYSFITINTPSTWRLRLVRVVSKAQPQLRLFFRASSKVRKKHQKLFRKFKFNMTPENPRKVLMYILIIDLYIDNICIPNSQCH